MAVQEGSRRAEVVEMLAEVLAEVLESARDDSVSIDLGAVLLVLVVIAVIALIVFLVKRF
jgi:predicted RNase H-like HicB family nuclease